MTAASENSNVGGNLSGQTIQAIKDAVAAIYRALGGDAGTPSSAPSLSPSDAGPVTVAEVVSELLFHKARRLCTDTYLYQLRHCYDLLNRRMAKRPLAAVTARELEDWLDDSEASPRTKRGRTQYLRMLFEFARRRNYVSHNPALAIDFPIGSPPEVCIHTPEQVRAVLDAALAQDVGLARALAVRYFAGLRTSELERLDEEAEIHLERRLIEVTAIKSKTRRRRLVSISDNLAAWLQLKGDIPGDLEKRITRAWEYAKVSWPRNVTRHTFCSYHLAQHQNAAKTALQAGHTEQVLFAHYRELVTPEAAAEFWAIVPK
jgi:integrase